MDFAIGCATLVMVVGMILAGIGLIWALIDGSLWHNPGETLMEYGFIVILVSMLAMLIIFFYFGAQCTFDPTNCKL